jgi:hypothetical protein
MLSVALAAGVGVLLSSCIADPPPDPAIAGVEIVATRDHCLLNRDSVAAGTHEIVVIMEAGSGKVRIVMDGKAVLERPIHDQSGVADQSQLELRQGEYVVECVVDGAASWARLTVTG